MAALSNLWQRIFTGALFLAVVIGSIIWSYWSFSILFGIVLIFATNEYLKITSVFSKPLVTAVFISNVAFYVINLIIIGLESAPDTYQLRHYLTGGYLSAKHVYMFSLFLFPVMIAVAEVFRKHEQPFTNIAFGVLGFMYLAIPFSLLLHISVINHARYDFQIILAFFCCLWINDIFAYVWGKLIGKHKLIPRISAGKTIEGTIGGILTAIGFTFIFPYIFVDVPFNMLQWMIFAFIITLLATPSDLTESMLKRQAGVKDSGKLLPGHGGVLDRFDSILLTVPVIFVYLKILQLS